jgi:hypothetical protein
VRVAIVAGGWRSYTDFARAAGIHPANLSHVLNYSVTPWPALRRRVCETLQLPEHELFPEVAEELAS